MTEITLFVPCDVVQVKMHLGYGRSTSPIEHTVLRAIVTGQDAEPGGVPVETLLNLFKLGERVTLDLIGDLLRRGHVVVDFRKATVRPAPGFDLTRLDRLAGGERFNATTELAVDRLVGSVQPVDQTVHRPTDFRFEVPIGIGRPEQVTETQLLAVLDAAVEQDNARRQAESTAQRRPWQVLAARLDPRALHRTVERRWLALDAGVRFDENAGHLRFTITDRRLSVAQRETAGERLGRITQQREGSRFVEALRGSAGRRLVEPPSLDELIDRFTKRTDAAADAYAGTRIRVHGDLTYLYDQIANTLRTECSYEVRASALLTADAHREAVLRFIGTARHQVVLACPKLAYDTVSQYYDALLDALSQGVQVVLLWGDDHDAELPVRVQTQLSDLSWRTADRKSGARLIKSSMSCRINASIAIADDRRALVTGYPFLGEGTAALEQLGICIEAPSDDACAPVESLLAWARSALRHQQGQLMYSQHDDFTELDAGRDGAGRGDIEPLDPGPSPWPNRDVPVPEPPPDTDVGELTASQVRLWARRWRDAAAGLREIAESRDLPQARLVVDGTHRALLWDALSQPGRLIMSGNLAHPRIVDERLIRALRQRAEAGRDTTVLFHRSTAAGTGRDAGGLLLELAADQKLTVERRSSNARALVTETETVVGSFDYLSARDTGSRYRDRAEVGLRLTGKAIADQCTRSLLAASDIAPIPVAVPRVKPVIAPAGAASARRLLDEVAAAMPSAWPEILAAQLEHVSDAWQVLADLEDAEAPRDVLRMAVAHSLRTATDVTGSDAQRWLRWLFEDRWRHHAFIESAVLHQALVDPAATAPRAELVLVAAARRGPAIGRALYGAWNDTLQRSEQVALAVTSIVDLLLCDEQPAILNDLVTVGVPELVPEFNVGEPWSTLVKAAVDYWTKTENALPVAHISAANAKDNDDHGLDEMWERLGTIMSRCRYARLGFNKTVRQLFDFASSPYRQLVTAVELRDADSVEDWIRETGSVGAEELFRQAEAVAAGLRKSLRSDERQAYVTNLAGIGRTAEDLVALRGRLATVTTDHRAEAASYFAAMLARVWPQLATAGPGGAEQVLVDAALADIEFVKRWGHR